MGSGYSKMKKQAKLMQQQYIEKQEELKTTQVKVKSGNGLVEITMNGVKELTSIKINPKCVNPEDVEGLEDLILAAHQSAIEKLEEKNTNVPNMPFHF